MSQQESTMVIANSAVGFVKQRLKLLIVEQSWSQVRGTHSKTEQNLCTVLLLAVMQLLLEAMKSGVD